MDKSVAGDLLDDFVHQLRARTYSDLRKLIGDPQCQELCGPDRKAYQIEFEAFWDDPRSPERNLRVIASVDDGTLWASFRPITKSFIMAPDGTFVGEPQNQT